jgi:hypothetical protein
VIGVPEVQHWTGPVIEGEARQEIVGMNVEDDGIEAD